MTTDTAGCGVLEEQATVVARRRLRENDLDQPTKQTTSTDDLRAWPALPNAIQVIQPQLGPTE